MSQSPSDERMSKGTKGAVDDRDVQGSWWYSQGKRASVEPHEWERKGLEVMVIHEQDRDPSSQY